MFWLIFSKDVPESPYDTQISHVIWKQAGPWVYCHSDYTQDHIGDLIWDSWLLFLGTILFTPCASGPAPTCTSQRKPNPGILRQWFKHAFWFFNNQSWLKQTSSFPPPIPVPLCSCACTPLQLFESSELYWRMKNILIKKNSFFFLSQLSSVLLHGYRASCAGLQLVTIHTTYFLHFSWFSLNNF